MKNKKFTIRMKIANLGKNSINVIPKLLQEDLHSQTIAGLNIKILEGSD